jgi:transcriptional regulator with XRE-family HTH domain
VKRDVVFRDGGEFGRVLRKLCTGAHAGRRRFTNVELAELVRDAGSEITHTYISQLRKGQKDNPSCRTLLDLARALRVHPACFVGGRQALRPGEAPRWRASALPRLFETVYPGGRGPYSPEEVAEAITRKGRYGSVSASHLRELLTGGSDNPRLKHLLALADHFGAPAAYFFDDQLATRVDQQLDTYRAMDALGVNTVIFRASRDTPPPEIGDKLLVELARALRPDTDPGDSLRNLLG